MAVDPNKKTQEEEADNLFAPRGVKPTSSPMASEQVNMVQAPTMIKPDMKADDTPALSGVTAAKAQEGWNSKPQEERDKLGHIGQGSSSPTAPTTPTEIAKQRIADGEEPFLALLQKNKPEKDEDKEKRLKRAGRLSAIVNALSTLAGGLPAMVGGSARGYAPQVDRSEEPFISQLNQLEEDYKVAEKEYQQLETSAAMKDLEYRLALEQAEKEKADRKAEIQEARNYEAQVLADKRAYEEEQTKRKVDIAREQARYEQELGNMYSAIGEGYFDGSFEDWENMDPKSRADIVQKTTNSAYQRALAAKIAGKNTGSATPKKPVVLDFGNGKNFTVSETFLKSNLSRLYNAMIQENLNLAAPKVNTGRKDEALNDIWRDPTNNEKYDYLVRNINESPAAQRLLTSILQQQGKLGLSGELSLPSSQSGGEAPTNVGYNAAPESEDFYRLYGGF